MYDLPKSSSDATTITIARKINPNYDLANSLPDNDIPVIQLSSENDEGLSPEIIQQLEAVFEKWREQILRENYTKPFDIKEIEQLQAQNPNAVFHIQSCRVVPKHIVDTYFAETGLPLETLDIQNANKGINGVNIDSKFDVIYIPVYCALFMVEENKPTVLVEHFLTKQVQQTTVDCFGVETTEYITSKGKLLPV